MPLVPGVLGYAFTSQARTQIQRLRNDGVVVLYANESYFPIPDHFGGDDDYNNWQLTLTIPDPNNPGQRIGRVYGRTIAADTELDPNGPEYVFEYDDADDAYNGLVQVGGTLKRKATLKQLAALEKARFVRKANLAKKQYGSSRIRR